MFYSLPFRSQAPAVLHMLQNFEFLAKPLAVFASNLVQGDTVDAKNGHKGLVMGILHEIGRIDSGLLVRDTVQRAHFMKFRVYFPTL
jgi:hypothetical protein